MIVEFSKVQVTRDQDVHFQKSCEGKILGEGLQPLSMGNSFKESLCKQAVAMAICGLKEDLCFVLWNKDVQNYYTVMGLTEEVQQRHVREEREKWIEL